MESRRRGRKITFKSANVHRNSNGAIAEIGEDGSYTIKTKVNANIIGVTPAKTNKRGGMYSMDVFEVKSDDNTHDVMVTKLWPARSACIALLLHGNSRSSLVKSDGFVNSLGRQLVP